MLPSRLSARAPSPTMKPFARGSIRDAKTSCTDLFRLSLSQSLRHKNDRAPFAATLGNGIRKRKKTQSP
jgi:hypothetical protein